MRVALTVLSALVISTAPCLADTASDAFKPYLRQDQIVVDSTSGKPTPPAGMIVLKKLVESKTVIGDTYVYAPGTIFKGKRRLVGNKVTTYEYLVDASAMPHDTLEKYVAEGKMVTEDHAHYFVWTASKIQGVKDLRNWAIVHPREARYIAFMDRWYARTRPIIVPLSILANALIIRG